MYNFNFNLYNLKYNFLKKNIILKIIKKNFFKCINNINIIFVNLLDIYIINKKYRFKNFATNLITFRYKNFCELIFCGILVEKYCSIYKIKIFFYYIHLLLHGFLHCQNFKHKKYFSKNNIMNKLEVKMLNKLGCFNPYYYFLLNDNS